MNIPRTRALVRYSPKPFKRTKRIIFGMFDMGIKNAEIAALVGEVIATLPHLEEHMIEVMQMLLGGSGAPARQIFRSLNSEDARVKIMRALLEQAPSNQHADQRFDDIIDLFVDVKKRRNAYAHGLWRTHIETNKVYLKEPSVAEEGFFQDGQRHITKSEVKDTLKKMRTLINQANHICHEASPNPKYRLLLPPKQPVPPARAK